MDKTLLKIIPEVMQKQDSINEEICGCLNEIREILKLLQLYHPVNNTITVTIQKHLRNLETKTHNSTEMMKRIKELTI